MTRLLDSLDVVSSPLRIWKLVTQMQLPPPVSARCLALLLTNSPAVAVCVIVVQVLLCNIALICHVHLD